MERDAEDKLCTSSPDDMVAYSSVCYKYCTPPVMILVMITYRKQLQKVISVYFRHKVKSPSSSYVFTGKG